MSRIIKVEVRVISLSLAETLINLDIMKTKSNNVIIDLLCIEQKKGGSHIFASSLTGSNRKCANLT